MAKNPLSRSSNKGFLDDMYKTPEMADFLQDNTDPFSQIRSCLGALTVMVKTTEEIAKAIEPADEPLRPHILRLDNSRRRLAIWVFEAAYNLPTLAQTPSFKSSTLCEVVTEAGESLHLNIDLIIIALSRITDCIKSEEAAVAHTTATMYAHESKAIEWTIFALADLMQSLVDFQAAEGNARSLLLQRPLYVPLRSPSDYIRLVSLRCGQFDDPIWLELTQAPLRNSIESPSYEALSYTWGNPEQICTVTLNKRPFQVTKNLEAALRHLRYKPQTRDTANNYRVLWVDAICINQEDIEERNLQVRQMFDIYKYALRVLLWLGEGDQDSDRAMTLMNKYPVLFPREQAGSGVVERYAAFQGMQFQGNWQALEQGFFTRPCWNRIWIVQEVAVAKEVIVVCGSYTIPWYVLSSYVKHSNEKSPQSHPCKVIDGIRDKWQSGVSCLLHQLVLTLRDFNATIAVDKLYACLGLCLATGDEDLYPDYSKATWQVYAEFTKHIIVQQKKLDFICAMNNIKFTGGLPSWVPDFQSANFIGPIPLKGLSTLVDDFLYNVSARKPMEVVFSDDLKTLQATGLLVDHIDTIAPYWDPGPYFTDFIESIRKQFEEWRNFIVMEDKRSVSKRYGSYSAVQLALSKTLTADRLMNFYPNGYLSRLPPDEGIFEVYVKRGPRDFKQDSGSLGSHLGWQQKWWYQIALNWFIGTLMHRCLALLRGGYIGLVPQSAKVGDVVCILYGCDTPVVLRPQDEDYSFVGECYIHGIMDGELVSGHEQEPIDSQVFVIK